MTSEIDQLKSDVEALKQQVASLLAGEKQQPAPKVGDVVDTATANALPVGSRVACEQCKEGQFHEKISDEGMWNIAAKEGDAGHYAKFNPSVDTQLTILRIGPGDEAQPAPQRDICCQWAIEYFRDGQFLRDFLRSKHLAEMHALCEAMIESIDMGMVIPVKVSRALNALLAKRKEAE